MFNSWGSLSSVLSRRKDRIKRRDSECSDNQDTLETITECDNRKHSKMSTVSSPGRLRITPIDSITLQKHIMRHGFSPMKMDAPPSKPVDICTRRQRSISEQPRNSTSPGESFRIGSVSKAFDSGSSPHVKLWEQAYGNGCR